MTQTFKVEHFKGIDNVQINASHGDLIIIAGKNGSGKSSFIDGITELFDSRGVRITPKPIKDGESKAVATFTDEALDVKLTRTWTKDDGGKLEMHSLDGAKYNKPAEALAGLTGGLIFDPVKFLNMDEKTQREELLARVDLPFDLAELARQKAGVEGRRLEAGREVKRLQGTKASLVAPSKDTPTVEMSAQSVIDEIRAAESVKRDADKTVDDLGFAKVRAESARADLEAAQAKLAAAETAISELEFKVATQVMPADIDALQEKLNGLEEVNAKVREARNFQAVSEQLAAAEDAQKKENDALAAIDAQKRAGLAEATWPDPGLGIDDGGVTLDGVPLRQANTARKILAALRIATSGDPDLKLVIISDGDMLDADSIQMVRELAAEKGYTVIVERDRDESRAVGFEIVEGRLVG